MFSPTESSRPAEILSPSVPVAREQMGTRRRIENTVGKTIGFAADGAEVLTDVGSYTVGRVRALVRRMFEKYQQGSTSQPFSMN